MEFSCAVHGGELEGENGKMFSLSLTNSLRILILSYQRRKKSCLGNACGKSIPSAHDIGNACSITPENAIHLLRSEYWSKIIRLTCAYEHLPRQEHEWWNLRLVASRNNSDHDKCHYLHLPEFNTDTVFGFVEHVTSHRPIALAKRIEQVFDLLCSKSYSVSGNGFLTCLNVEALFNKWNLLDVKKTGAINGLRCLISELSESIDKPLFSDTAKKIQLAKGAPGSWVEMDSGRLKLAVFDGGHAKVVIDTEVAGKLNVAYFDVGIKNKSLTSFGVGNELNL